MTSYRQSMKDTLQIMYDVREASLLERDLTPDEEKRREEIAKDLPDDDFKKRYGDKWMSVKMATATKMMKKEEVDLDERMKLPRQLFDKNKEVMIVKKNKVIVIDKKDQDKYMKQGWSLAEEVDLEEGNMKDLAIKGQDLETYAKKSGGIDKNDMMKVAAMLKKGNKSGAMKYAMGLDTDPKEYILNLIGEEVDLDEAKMSASQIAALKKAYEPMRGKKMSMDSGNKLRSIMDKIDDDKQALIQLVKADIPFVSALAVTRLISKHDMKGAEINKLKEEVELDEKMSPSDQDRLDDLLMAYRWGKSSYGFDDYNEGVPNPDDVVKLIRKEFGNKIADQLVKSDDKIKVGLGGGPSDRKTPTRITKTGKANKADLNALKTRLKKKRDWDKIAPKGKLPEEVDLDEDIMPLIFGGGIIAALLPVLFMSVREIIRGTPLESSIKKIVDKLKKNKNYKMSDSEKSDVKGFVSKVKKEKPSLLQKAMKKIKEEVELDEGKMGDQWQKGAKSVKSGPFELMRGKSGVHAIMQNGKKLGDFSYDDDADNFVANMKGMKGQWVGNDIDSLINHLQKVHKEEVDLEEASAAADARRAMRRDPDMKQRAFSKDDSATDDDKKAASKNIMVQMRKAQSLGYFNVEFQDGKKIKIPAKLAIAVQQKYNAMRKPSDKEAFQAKVGKSYRDMLNALKEEAVSPAQQAAIAISKKERGEKPKKESILDRIDRKIKENKNG